MRRKVLPLLIQVHTVGILLDVATKRFLLLCLPTALLCRLNCSDRANAIVATAVLEIKAPANRTLSKCLELSDFVEQMRLLRCSRHESLLEKISEAPSLFLWPLLRLRVVLRRPEIAFVPLWVSLSAIVTIRSEQAADSNRRRRVFAREGSLTWHPCLCELFLLLPQPVD